MNLLSAVSTAIATVLTFGTGLLASAGFQTPDIEWAESTDSLQEYIYIDTLALIDGIAIGPSWDEDTPGFYYGTECLTNDPTIHIDSVGPTTYLLDFVGRELTLDLGDPSCLTLIRHLGAPLPGYNRIKCDTFDISSANLTIDRPDDPYLRIWLMGVATELLPEGSAPLQPYTSTRPIWLPEEYTGAVDDYNYLNWWLAYNFGLSYLEDEEDYEDDIEDEDYEEERPTLITQLDIRMRLDNDRFATCRVFDYDYGGGAHGYYTEQLCTFDKKNHCPVTNGYLFKPGNEDAIWYEVCAAVAKNPSYVFFSSEDSLTADMVAERLNVCGHQDPTGMYESAELPDAGITDDYFVFSFQPYSISCFAAGVIHAKVPHQSLMPYLTPAAKALIEKK